MSEAIGEGAVGVGGVVATLERAVVAVAVVQLRVAIGLLLLVARVTAVYFRVLFVRVVVKLTLISVKPKIELSTRFRRRFKPRRCSKTTILSLYRFRNSIIRITLVKATNGIVEY